MVCSIGNCPKETPSQSALSLPLPLSFILPQKDFVLVNPWLLVSSKPQDCGLQVQDMKPRFDLGFMSWFVSLYFQIWCTHGAVTPGFHTVSC